MRKTFLSIFVVLSLLFVVVSAEEIKTPQVEPTGVQEIVKCVFAHSQVMQECYSDNHKFSCAGIGNCVMEVAGQRGQTLTWKSSCDGMSYTVVDGNLDYAEFNCNNKPANSLVKEKVKCFFINSNVKQECYAADAGPAGCPGVGSCTAEITETSGKKITWKSSCGGYAYSTMDGTDEGIEFKCIPEEKVSQDIISEKGFRYAYWQCYDGADQKQGNENECNSGEVWEKVAKGFCMEHCNEDNSKCGINLFSVIEDCYF